MSLKGDKYETADEVRFRLEHTVVSYDGDPVYITRVNAPAAGKEEGDVARVFFQPLPIERPEGKEVRKYLSSKKFDLAPFKMGYMNHGGNAIFVSRTPVRQNKQGLSAGTALYTNVRGQRCEAFGFNHMTKAPGFVDMVKGVFPSFKEAGDMLGDKGVTSVAISRSFAFVIDHDFEMLLMIHKGVKCGIAMKGARALQVPPKFLFLREEMEDHRIPVA